MARIALLFLLNNKDKDEVPYTARFPQMQRLLCDERFGVYAMCVTNHEKGMHIDFKKHVTKFVLQKPGRCPQYGKKSLAVAMKDLLHFAVMDDERNSHFFFASESCLPMWNPDVIYAAITGDFGGSTWMSRWDGPQRAGQQFLTCRDHAMIILQRFDEVMADKYDDDDNTWAVDELVFLETLQDVPNVLHYAEGPTFVDWERPVGSHPHTFDAHMSKEDLFRLLASDALFCRKVTSDAEKIVCDNVDVVSLFLDRDISWWKMTHRDKGSAHHVFNTFRIIYPFLDYSRI